MPVGVNHGQGYAAFWTGICMAMFSAGRAVSALLLNCREHTLQSMRIAAAACFVFSLIAAVMYLLARTAQILAAARAVAGVGAGALSLMMVALVAASSESDRSVALSNYFLAAAVGEISGPLLLWASTGIQWRLRLPWDGWSIDVDKYNVAGLWTFAIFCACFVLVFRSLSAKDAGVEEENEPEHADRSPLVDPLVTAEVKRAEEGVGDDDHVERPEETSQPLESVETLASWMISRRLVLLFLANAATNFAVAAWETIVTPFGSLFFGWDVAENSIIFIASGVVLLLSSLLVRASARIGLSDYAASCACVALSGVGATLLLTLPSATTPALDPLALSETAALPLEEAASTVRAAPSFVGGMATFIAANVAFTLGIFALLTFFSSLYTKAVVARPGFFIGVLRTTSALSRVIGNVAAAHALSRGSAGHGVSAISPGPAAICLVACPAVMVILLLGLKFCPSSSPRPANGGRRRNRGASNETRTTNDDAKVSSTLRVPILDEFGEEERPDDHVASGRP
jgi:MFS family permease